MQPLLHRRIMANASLSWLASLLQCNRKKASLSAWQWPQLAVASWLMCNVKNDQPKWRPSENLNRGWPVNDNQWYQRNIN